MYVYAPSTNKNRELLQLPVVLVKLKFGCFVPGSPESWKEIAADVGDTRLDFLTKEPVSGELLSARLARGPMSTEEAVRCAIGIGAARHKIHSRRFVHGALSPYCVALASGRPRILEPTPSPDACAAYRSPEQVRGAE